MRSPEQRTRSGGCPQGHANAMPCHAMPCMCMCMYVRSNPFGGATQCMEPYRYIVGNHAPPQMQGRLLGPSSDGGPSSYRVGGKPDSCDAEADACISSTGTAQHRRPHIRGHHTRYVAAVLRGQQASDAHDKQRSRRIRDYGQLGSC